jgi:hypothetical protein
MRGDGAEAGAGWGRLGGRMGNPPLKKPRVGHPAFVLRMGWARIRVGHPPGHRLLLVDLGFPEAPFVGPPPSLYLFISAFILSQVGESVGSAVIITRPGH